jgi:hypothetical protein
VQASTICRLFGDRNGLLDAVAAERTLLGDSLERIASSQHGPGTSSMPQRDSGTVDE